MDFQNLFYQQIGLHHPIQHQDNGLDENLYEEKLLGKSLLSCNLFESLSLLLLNLLVVIDHDETFNKNFSPHFSKDDSCRMRRSLSPAITKKSLEGKIASEANLCQFYNLFQC